MDISINYEGWHMDIMWDDFHDVTQVTITKDRIADNRTYDILEAIEKVEHNGQYVFIYVEGEMYYQFKFEDNDFIVGDIFTTEGDFINSFANYVLGEN